MAHYFPPLPFIANEVCDVDQLNFNFATIHSELSALNEHNWDLSALQNYEQRWARDIAIRMHSTTTDLDPYGGSVVAVAGNGQWAVLSGGSKTATTRGGILHVMASFQVETVTNDAASREPGLMFALRVDGAVEHGSLVGSADLSNDTVLQSTLGGGAQTPKIDFQTAPALRGGYIPVVIEKQFRVSAGVHTVEVVARNVKTSSAAVSQDVSQMCLMVLEMWS